MIPVVELLRVSTETQAAEDRTALAAQHSVNERTCDRYKLKVVERVQVVLTGAEVADTPEMAHVLELITSGRARGVVLAEYSRLFRPDRWTDLRVLQTLADHAANIYLPSGPLDLLTEAGFVGATVNNMMSALERRRIRERMHRGKEELRRRNGHTMNAITLPLGLACSKAGEWSYTDDIAKVREVFRLFLQGERNMQEIGRQAGVPRSSVHYILQNPVYTGWRIFDKKRDAAHRGTKYKRSVARAPEEVIRFRLPLEPVISAGQFEQVQALLDEHRRRRPRRAQHPLRYLYRGFVACTCGQPLYGVIAGGAKLPYYRCRSTVKVRCPEGVEPCGASSMRADKLEPVLDAVLSDRLLDPTVLTPAIEAYNDSLGSRLRRPESLSVEQRTAQAIRRRTRVVDAYVEGAIDRAERDRRLGPIDRELAILRVAPPPQPSPQPLELEDVEMLLQPLAEWLLIERAARRKLLEGLRPDLEVRQYDVISITLPLCGLPVSRIRTRWSPPRCARRLP